MKKVEEGELVGTPGAERVARSHLTRYLKGRAARGQRFDDYEALWRWSVADLPGFWQSVVEFCGMEFSSPPQGVLGRREMPGAEWFPTAGGLVVDGIRAAGARARDLDAGSGNRAR